MIKEKTINYLLVVFALVLVIESLFLSGLIKKPDGVQSNQASQLTSSLGLEGPATVGKQPFNVSLKAWDAQPIGALDALIDFDPTKVQVVSLDTPVKDPGAEYPQAIFDNDKGTIALSLVMFTKPLDGSREIANIKLQPVGKGEASLNIRFAPGQTTDSNVVLEGSTQDSLSQVNNYKVTIN